MHGNSTHREGYISRRTAEYVTWINLKQRCLNPNRPDYYNYGGRGITVCQRWVESYEDFLSDMGRRPSKFHSIERVDNDGPYEPENCKWATRHEQNLNQRRNQLARLRRAA